MSSTSGGLAPPTSSAPASAAAAQAIEADPVPSGSGGGGGGRAGATASTLSASLPVPAGVAPESYSLPPGRSFSDGDAAAARGAGLLSASVAAPAASGDSVSAGLLSSSSLAEVIGATNGGAQVMSGLGAATATATPRASAAAPAVVQPRGGRVAGMSAEELVEAVTARVSAVSGLYICLLASIVHVVLWELACACL